MTDRFELNRFVEAQARSYRTAFSEITGGRKKSHWMWFVFPQLKDLGRSDTAKFYGIGDIREAAAYLTHPVLGKNLVEISDALLGISGKTATEIFGSPDDLKLRSSMTLFAKVAGEASVFERVLDKYFDGLQDKLTLQILEKLK